MAGEPTAPARPAPLRAWWPWRHGLRSLSARLVLLVFGATLVTSLTVTAVSVQSIHSFLRAKIDRKFPDLLASTAKRLHGWYEQREGDIEVFAAREILRENLPRASRHERARAEIDTYLRYVLESSPHYAALVLLDAEARVRFWVGAEVELDDSLAAELAAGTSPQVSDGVSAGGRRLQFASAPVRDGERRIGSLHAVLQLDELSPILADHDLADSGRIHLLGQQAQHFCPDDHEAPVLPRVARSSGAAAVAEYRGSNGERLVGAVQPFGRFGWTLLVEQRSEDAFAPVMGSVRQALVINLAIVLVLGAAAFRIAVSIARPIEALSEAARRISEDEPDVALPEIDRQDEVGVLTRSLRHMTERLRAQNEMLQQANQGLEQLSMTDALTDLHNHRAFQDALDRAGERASRTGQPLALILIDIDHFKRWNDRHGHATGDRLLSHVARVLSGCVRETDFLARYGGEEFALIAPGTDIEDAERLAETLRAAVARRTDALPAGEDRLLTVSLGVAPFEGDVDALFEAADRALYRAKDAGRDAVMVARRSG